MLAADCPRPVRLSWVLATHRPAYGGTWRQARAQLLADPAEQSTIEHLRWELAGNAESLFDQPVWLDRRRRVVRNGMHRLVAAQLGGARRVLVRYQVPEQPSTEMLTVTLWLRLPNGTEYAEFGLSWLRSFRLTLSTWVETDIVVATGRAVELTYYCPHALETALLAALRTRAKRVGGEVLHAEAQPWVMLADGEAQS